MWPSKSPSSNWKRLTSSILAGILAGVTITSASGQTVGSNGIIYAGDRVVKESIASSAYVSQVSAGSHHAIALKLDGSIVAWGSDNWGQCDVPKNLYNVKQVVAVSDYTVLLMKDGTVRAFGYGLAGQTMVPPGLNNVRQIAAGPESVIALKNDGSVVAWGDNSSGQLNIPSTLGVVVQVAAGNGFFVALQANGKLACWGNNSVGACSPPSNLTPAGSISACEDRAAACLNNGQVVCWGGDPSLNIVPPGVNNAAQVAVGPTHTLVLKWDHSLAAFGTNYSGEVVSNPYAPGATSIAAGDRTSFAVDQNGQIDSWGESTFGQSIAPWEIADSSLGNISKIAAGYNHLMMLQNFAGGSVRSWGANLSGQCAPILWMYKDISGGVAHSALTTSTNGWPYVPAALIGDNSDGQCTPVGTLNNYDQLWAVGNSTYGHLKTGGVVAWGSNQWNALNLPKNYNYQQIAGGDFGVLGLLPNGTVLGAGTNTDGQFTIPAGLSNIQQVACGSRHNLALDNNGHVTAWGKNSSGQTSVPSNLSGVLQIGAGEAFSVALQNNGAVQAWGSISQEQPNLPSGLPAIGQIAAGQHFVAMLPFLTQTTYPAIDLAGDAIKGTVSVTWPSAGPTVVKLSSSNPCVSVPATVTIPAGQLQASYPIQSTDPAATTSVVVTATLGLDSFNSLLTISPAPYQLSTNQAAIVGGSTTPFSGTVKLLKPAPAGGAIVKLSVSDPTAVGIPSQLLFVTGQQTATFAMTTNRVHTAELVNVTASYAGTTRTQVTSVRPFAVMSMVMTQNSVLAGAPATATVTLNATPASPVSVAMTSSNTTVQPNPPAFNISGSATGSETFVTNKVLNPGTVTLKGTVDGQYGSDSLTLVPAIKFVTMPTGTIYGGAAYWVTTGLALPAPATGFSLNVTGTNCTLQSTIQYSQGQSVIAIPVVAADVSSPAQLGVTITSGPEQFGGTLNIVPNTPKTLTASPQTFYGSLNTVVTGTVTLQSPVALDTIVTLKSSNPAVAGVPTQVIVKANTSSATFNITHSAVTVNTLVVVTATHAGGSVPVDLIVEKYR